MGMSSYVMDCEDKFIDEVSARIGGCESVNELIADLEKAGCVKLVVHMGCTYQSFVRVLWNDYWSNYANG